jgi:uncharacterized membrane protein
MVIIVVMIVMILIVMIVIVMVVIVIRMARTLRPDRCPTADRRKSYTRETRKEYGVIDANH